MNIDSKKIEQVIQKASNIIITAHKSLDLDALGSLLSMHYVCNKYGKSTTILIDDEEHESGVKRALRKIESLDYKVDIKTFAKLKKDIDSKTLLIVVDTNKNNRVQNEKIFSYIKRVIVIDHHIIDKDNIKDSDYSYIDSERSSTSEIIVDLIKELNIYIPDYVATVMLAGMIIDTNNFYLKTTKDTHYAAGALKEFNADITETQYLLKQDFNKYIERQKVIINAEFVTENIAIALCDQAKVYEKEELAKIADTILLFKNVEASFVIGKTDSNEVSISARSLGQIDVQILMEKLSGGGHKTDAATQLKDKTIMETEQMLLELISK